MKKNLTLDRDHRIDNIRAISIALVVLAHSIIIYNGVWSSYSTSQTSEILKYLCNFIYIFHMPLFFSISGNLFKNKKEKINKVIQKKTLRLLIPFLTVGILYMIPIRYLAHYPSYDNPFFAIVKLLTGQDSGHLWFLPALFLIFLYQCVLDKIIKNAKIQDVIAALLFVVGTFVPTYFGKALQNIIWFRLGYRIKDAKTIKTKKSGYICLISFLLLSVLYFVVPKDLPYYSYIASFIKTVSAGMAIVSCFSLMPNKHNRVLSYISKHSFGIYLFHSPLIYLTFCYFSNIAPSIMLLINFVGLGSLALLMSIIVNKSKRMRFIIGLPCQKEKN